MSGLSDSIREMEAKALSMLKSGHQPADVARVTGLSQIWMEMKARGLGIQPLKVEGLK